RFTALTGKHTAIYLVPTAIGARIKNYSTKPIILATMMAILGELGLAVTDEYPFSINRLNQSSYYLYAMRLIASGQVNIASLVQLLQDTVAAAIVVDIEADSFNKLLLHQGISPDMVAVLRAYGHYLRQLQLPTSLDFMAEVLLANPSVTSGLA